MSENTRQEKHKGMVRIQFSGMYKYENENTQHTTNNMRWNTALHLYPL